MLNVFSESGQNTGNDKYAKCLGLLTPPISQKTFNIFNISPVLSTFDKKHLSFPLFREPGVTKQGKC